MGVLNNKERIIDTVVTDVGREQLAKGEFEPRYVSFTDSAASYDSVTSSIKIYVEAPDSLPHDRITFVHTPLGGINFIKPGEAVINGGSIFTSTGAVTGSAFSTTASTILSASFDNLAYHRLLRTDDIVFDDNDFVLDTPDVVFDLTDDSPINRFDVRTAKLKDIESLFQDRRLSHLPNFAYMPPVNKRELGVDPVPLGMYAKIGQPKLTPDNLQTILATKPHKRISFSETSDANNIICQMFELRNNCITKLDVIDYGYHKLNPADEAPAHIFFVGKVYNDKKGTPTFVNLFTVVFE